MFSLRKGLLIAVAGLGVPWITAGQEKPAIPIPDVIQKFAANESELVKVRASYTYRQDVRVQSLDKKNAVTGEHRVVSQFAPAASGNSIERVLEAPLDTLKGFGLTPQDMVDIRETQSAVLTTDEIEKYNVTYRDKENVNGTSCLVFDVKPKKVEKDQRYFEGRIWVEDRDYHIIKSNGKSVPDIQSNREENLFPRFEMNRELVDGYWFPKSIQADDTLQFSSGPQHIRQITIFENYRKP
ncbi:MAG TPA: hypothetical protein VK210_03340 [Terriglobia bacterium]|nr:hypothetical protein [Terriglobia bacterium]